MCGILGTVNFAGSHAVAEERAARSLAMLKHRGPDDEGTWWSGDRRVFLGHRRLSIIDLSSAGHQPMISDDGMVQLVYNGEVYNFMELRAELEARGHRFTSRTDTEAILRGYLEYGEGVVERLRGMFAFAIHDARSGTLFIARDRLGIKPLYYTWAGGAFTFASEIRPLLELAGIERRPNLGALGEYLTFGKVYAPHTMFEGVMKFPAAHVAAVGPDGMRARRFWSPYAERMEFPEDREDALAGRLLGLLEESVRLRTLSDVPVGVFLSGGVDSTANVALMSRATGGRVHTFTAGFEGEAAYDERLHARAAAEYYRTEHEEIEISRRDMIAELPGIAGYLDEPVADPTVIPIFYLSKLARAAGAIVILNGDGGDELFCGYRKSMRYLRLSPYWKAYNVLPRPMRRMAAGAARALGVRGVMADLLDRAGRGVEMYVGATGPLKGTAAFSEITAGGPLGEHLYDAVSSARREFLAERRSRDYAEWLSYWGIRSEVENVFLYRADRMGMANSIEIRVPFLDHRVVEFAMQMPQRWKYHGGETKYILKRALQDVVPDRFLYRRKQGFCVPLRQWSGPMIDDHVRRMLPRMRDDWGAPSRAFVERALAMLGGPDDGDGALSWMLFNLAVWYEQWFLHE